jgi:hypothetical protein
VTGEIGPLYLPPSFFMAASLSHIFGVMCASESTRACLFSCWFTRPCSSQLRSQDTMRLRYTMQPIMYTLRV